MPYRYHLQGRLTYFKDIRADEIHNTCEEAAKAAWELVIQDDVPGWMLSKWLRSPDGKGEDWESAFIQGFVKDVAEEGFFKVIYGHTGFNFVQITRVGGSDGAQTGKS